MQAVSATRRDRGPKRAGESLSHEEPNPVLSADHAAITLDDGPGGWNVLQQLSREFHRGVFTVWILEALYDAPPTSVYELVERLRERAGHDYPVWPSPVYRTLGRLRSRGLVELVQRRGPGGSPRRYYRLSDAGHDTYPLIRSLAARSWGSAPSPLASIPGPTREPPFPASAEGSRRWGAKLDTQPLPAKDRFAEGA